MIRPCGRRLFELVPKREVSVDLNWAKKAFEKSGYEIIDFSELVLSVKKRYDISIFPNGKMLIFPADTNDEAEMIGRDIYALMKDENCIRL